MTKDPTQLIENGFVSITLGISKLRTEGKFKEADEYLRQLIMLLEEDRQDIRKTAKIDV
jgi:Arc/MetJ-type ribon-helix-helix transcriptional regulator